MSAANDDYDRQYSERRGGMRSGVPTYEGDNDAQIGDGGHRTTSLMNDYYRGDSGVDEFGGMGFSGYQQMDDNGAVNYDMNFNYDDQESQQSNLGMENYHGGGMQSEYDFGNYYNDANYLDGDRKYNRANTEFNF